MALDEPAETMHTHWHTHAHIVTDLRQLGPRQPSTCSLELDFLAHKQSLQKVHWPVALKDEMNE